MRQIDNSKLAQNRRAIYAVLEWSGLHLSDDLTAPENGAMIVSCLLYTSDAADE